MWERILLLVLSLLEVAKAHPASYPHQHPHVPELTPVAATVTGPSSVVAPNAAVPYYNGPLPHYGSHVVHPPPYYGYPYGGYGGYGYPSLYPYRQAHRYARPQYPRPQYTRPYYPRPYYPRPHYPIRPRLSYPLSTRKFYPQEKSLPNYLPIANQLSLAYGNVAGPYAKVDPYAGTHYKPVEKSNRRKRSLYSPYPYRSYYNPYGRYYNPYAGYYQGRHAHFPQSYNPYIYDYQHANRFNDPTLKAHFPSNHYGYTFQQLPSLRPGNPFNNYPGLGLNPFYQYSKSAYADSISKAVQNMNPETMWSEDGPNYNLAGFKFDAEEGLAKG